MKTLQKLATAALASAMFPLVASMAEAATVATIDPLTDSQNVGITPFGSNPTSTESITTSLLGSVDRTLTVASQNPPTGNNVIADIPRGAEPGFSLSTGDFTNGVATLDYGTFGPIDFTTGGADRISIGLVSSDLPGAEITLLINGISFTTTVGTAPPEQQLDFLFSSFAGLDATAVTSFGIVLDPVLAGDLSIRFLETQTPPVPQDTPEPATMLGLMAIAGFGASALKKKQR